MKMDKKIETLLIEAELRLDFYNYQYGTKKKLCLCCHSIERDSIVGIIHKDWCIIRRIREALKENGTI